MFDENVDEVVDRAKVVGVTGIIVIGIDLLTVKKPVICSYPGFLFGGGNPAKFGGRSRSAGFCSDRGARRFAWGPCDW